MTLCQGRPWRRIARLERRSPKINCAMQAIAEGTLQEAHAEDGEVKSALGDGSFRGVAVHRATALLLDESRVPADLALRFLPWLLSASPSDSLAVLKVSANCAPL